MSHRFLALAAAVCMVMAAGCSKPTETSSGTTSGGTTANPTGSDKPRPVIGVSLLTLQNPFFKTMGDAMKDEGAKRGYDVDVTTAEKDASTQNNQVNEFIVKKVSAIVLNPCDSRSVGATIQAANKAGIPVFTADIACLDKAAHVTTHIATDNYAGGKLAGQAMIEALHGRGKVAIIDHPEVESAIQRNKGFKDVIATAKGIQIVADLPGGGLTDPAFKAAQDILEQNPQLDGIFAINDPMAFGALAALEKAGRTAGVKVIGFDGSPDALEDVKAGKIYADAVQDPDRIGRLTIQTISKYMGGEKVPAQILIPTSIVHQADAAKASAPK